MELPERFRYDDDDGGDQDQIQDMDRTQAVAQMPFMAQSIFGIIATTQSKANTLQSMLQEADSDSDEDVVPSQTHKPAIDSTLPLRQTPPIRNKHLKRLSEHKLVQSLPGLRAKPSPSLSPSATHLAQEDNEPEQSHSARADLESSQLTIIKPASRKESPVPDMSSSQHTALPDALKEIFQLDEAETVVASMSKAFVQFSLVPIMTLPQNTVAGISKASR